MPSFLTLQCHLFENDEFELAKVCFTIDFLMAKREQFYQSDVVELSHETDHRSSFSFRDLFSPPAGKRCNPGGGGHL